MDVKVKTVTKNIEDVLKRIGKNVDFATARGLTDAATVVRAVERTHLGDNMKIRTDWLWNAMVVRPADKKALVAGVGVRRGARGNDLAPDLILGGERAPGPGGQQAIPKFGSSSDLRGYSMPRGDTGEKKTLRGSNWPGLLIKQVLAAAAMRSLGAKGNRDDATRRKARRAFPRLKAVKGGLVFMQHAAVPTIAVRIGKGEFRPLWYLAKGVVHIPKLWPFQERGSETAREQVPIHVQHYIKMYLQQVRTT